MSQESSPNNEEKRSSETKCVQVTATGSFDEFVQDPASQTQSRRKPYHGTFDEIALNVQKSRENHSICFEVYQQRKNKRKESRSNITKRIIRSRTLAIQMEPINPRQRQARQKVDSFRRRARIIACTQKAGKYQIGYQMSYATQLFSQRTSTFSPSSRPPSRKTSSLRLQKPHLRIQMTFLDHRRTSHGKASYGKMCELQ